MYDCITPLGFDGGDQATKIDVGLRMPTLGAMTPLGPATSNTVKTT